MAVSALYMYVCWTVSNKGRHILRWIVNRQLNSRVILGRIFGGPHVVAAYTVLPTRNTMCVYR